MKGLKKEVPVSQSPTLGAVQSNGDPTHSIEPRPSPGTAMSTMPPPSGSTNTPRYPSGSPHPQALGLSNHVVNNHHPPANAFDSRLRQPGKGKSHKTDPVSIDNLLTLLDASDAFVANLSISTHPGLNLDRHFHLDVPPSPTSTQQTMTINLPSTHFFIRICPTLAPNLGQRPHKVFVTANMQRLNPIPQKPEETDSRMPSYEARILPGVNRIEIEVVAGQTRGAPKIGLGQEYETEKVTVLAHLGKS